MNSMDVVFYTQIDDAEIITYYILLHTKLDCNAEFHQN